MSAAHDTLEQLRAERNTLAATRTREDVRKLAEDWLAAACARTNGTAAGFVLNGHASPGEVQAVLSEYLLDSPALLDFITASVEATTELSDRQKKQRLAKLDAEIAKLTEVVREAAKAEAIAAVERQYAGEAA
jgi:hypothetical protein